MCRYDEPSPAAYRVVHGLVSLRQFVLRHLTLPRFFPVVEFSQDPKTGRYHHNNYQVHPFYVKPSFWNRWGLGAWTTWALGGIVPGGANGGQYMPEGYFFDEVGPERKKGVGQKELAAWEKKIEASRPVGCPFR